MLVLLTCTCNTESSLSRQPISNCLNETIGNTYSDHLMKNASKHTVQVQILVHIPVLPQAVRGAGKALAQFHLCSEAENALQSGLSILQS